MGPEECVICGESVSELWGMLTEHQQVVVLLVAQGYGQEEIGVRLGIGQPNVCKCMRRVRNKLKKRLGRGV